MGMKFKVKNFRNFEETDFIEYRPFTLIYGKNGAGKSSLLYLYKIAHAIVNSELTDLFETGINKEEFGLEDIENYIGHDSKKKFEITFRFDLFSYINKNYNFDELPKDEDLNLLIELYKMIIPDNQFDNNENLENYLNISNDESTKLFNKINIFKNRLENLGIKYFDIKFKFKKVDDKFYLKKCAYYSKYFNFGFNSLEKEIKFMNKEDVIILFYIFDLELKLDSKKQVTLLMEILQNLKNNYNNLSEKEKIDIINNAKTNIMESDTIFLKELLSKKKYLREYINCYALIYDNKYIEFHTECGQNEEIEKLIDIDLIERDIYYFYINTFWLMNNLKETGILGIFKKKTINPNKEDINREINQIEKYFFNLFDMNSNFYPQPVNIDINRILKFSDIVKNRNFDDFYQINNNLQQINDYLYEYFKMNLYLQESNILYDKKKKVNLVVVGNDKKYFDPLDLGSGFKNILSILYFIYSNKNESHYEKILLIEEPELNLHPDLQSKFINIIFDVYSKIKMTNNGNTFYGNKDSFFEFNTIEFYNHEHQMYREHKFHDYNTSFRFILETHSENMLWKFYRLVKEKKLSQEEFGLYYVDIDTNGKSIFINLNLDSGGGMAKFPKSFFQSRMEDMLF